MGNSRILVEIIGGNMEKPFTMRTNELHLEIVNKLNEAKMPCFVLKTILLEIIKEIEDADGKEIADYLTNKDKEQEEK